MKSKMAGRRKVLTLERGRNKSIKKWRGQWKMRLRTQKKKGRQGERLLSQQYMKILWRCRRAVIKRPKERK